MNRFFDKVNHDVSRYEETIAYVVLIVLLIIAYFTGYLTGRPLNLP